MPIYEISLRGDLPEDDDPWHRVKWDVYFSFVVRAENEARARYLIHENIGRLNIKNGVNPWLSDRYSTCEEIKQDGKEEVLSVSYYDG